MQNKKTAPKKKKLAVRKDKIRTLSTHDLGDAKGGYCVLPKPTATGNCYR